MQEISIGQLATRTGLAVSAIRYYETQGLLAPLRNAGGQRRYPKSDIRRLSFVIIAQNFGFSLGRIAELLEDMPIVRAPTGEDWVAISRKLSAELDQRIATLTKLREDLDGCIGCGCLSMKNCALYNPDDRARLKGAGPRYLMGDSPAR
jgi:MerR family redox-sensitive transcriptional activator SoxR